jgi:hypothetical protein
MLKIPKPIILAESIVDSCIGGIDNPELKARFEAAKLTLVATNTNFNILAECSSLHQIPRVQAIGNVTSKEMQTLYETQMSSASGAARDYYNSLRGSSPLQKCPLCGIGVVSTLDHHLPKSKYPDLAVSPLNLVPSCSDCNTAKRANFPRDASEQTIHPYYDDFTDEQWLGASLDKQHSPVILYNVLHPKSWDEVKYLRALRHFTILKLSKLYTSNANDELITLKDTLQIQFLSQGMEGVRSYLKDQAIRYMRRVNSWQHVMYQALYTDDWFCSEGFNHIPEPE